MKHHCNVATPQELQQEYRISSKAILENGYQHSSMKLNHEAEGALTNTPDFPG
jgi:hypothetical protein